MTVLQCSIYLIIHLQVTNLTLKFSPLCYRKELKRFNRLLYCVCMSLEFSVFAEADHFAETWYKHYDSFLQQGEQHDGDTIM